LPDRGRGHAAPRIWPRATHLGRLRPLGIAARRRFHRGTPEMEGTPPPRHTGDGGAAAAGMAGVRGERTGATVVGKIKERTVIFHNQ
jgi:hypothetical protein